MNIYLLVLPEDGLLWYIGRGHQPSLPHPLPGRRWCCRLLQCLLHPGSFSPSWFLFSFRLLYLEICILVLLVTILTYFLRSWQRWCVPVATLCRCLWIIPYIWDWPSWSWSVLSEYSSFLGYAVHFFWAPDLLGPFSLESLWTGFLYFPKSLQVHHGLIGHKYKFMLSGLGGWRRWQSCSTGSAASLASLSPSSCASVTLFFTIHF